VIWPSQLLGYGDGGELGAGRGRLQLPYDIVASEFLTMEGKQFSTSRNVVIHVGDFLDRYDADSLRYFLTAAGPETQDTDFTWAEFVRRNNDELVANWGNLVNRTLQNAYKNFGRVPEAGTLTAEDEEVIAAVEAGFDTVGEQIEQARFRAAIAEAMHIATRVNQYLSEQAPWAVLETDRERAGTILNVALRCIDNLKVLFTPFLPHSSQQLHELLGHEGAIAGPLEFRDVTEDDGSLHTVLTGDYETWVGRWEPSTLSAGTELQEPRPLFRKLDPEGVVAEELERMTRVAEA
jgi:methionyl-tRNA synthetase